MKPIESIPTTELRQDLTGTLTDIAVCEKALALGITEYRGGNYTVRERLEKNGRVRDIITAELERRGAASVVVLNTRSSRLNTKMEGSRMTEQEVFNCEDETEALTYWWEDVTLGHNGQLVEVEFD